MINKILFSAKEPYNNENSIKELLFQVLIDDNNNYSLALNECRFDNDIIVSKNSPWFIFKSSKLEDKHTKYKIKEGDIIRFGKIITRIKEINKNKNKYINNRYNSDLTIIKSNKNCSDNGLIHLSLSNNSRFSINKCDILTSIRKKYNNNKKVTKNNKNNENKLQNFTVSLGNLSNREKGTKICRICYTEEEDKKDNPLVQPCNCSGSMKYIHLKCLKQCINTRNRIKIESNEIFTAYIIKQVECELCKMKLPDFVTHNGNIYEISEVENDYESYMILESLTLDKHKNKCLYIISLDKNRKIKLGRGRDSNIILNDISISRLHSILTIDNKNVFIEDNNSKFGTTILIQSSIIKLTDFLPLIIQIGRTYFSCKVKKKIDFFSCCNIFEKQSVNYYYEQNKLSQRIITVKAEMDYSYNTIDEDESENEKNKHRNDSDDNNTKYKLLLDEKEDSEIFDRKNKKIATLEINKVNKRYIGDNLNTNRNETKNEQKDKGESKDSESISIELESEED